MEHGCDALWISCQAGRKVITYATNKSQELGFLGRNFPFIKMEFVKNIQYTWKAMSFPSAYKQAGCVLLGFLHLLHGDPGPRCFMKGRKRQILSIHQWPERTQEYRVINLYHVTGGEIGGRSVVDLHPGLTPGGKREQLLFLHLGGFCGQTVGGDKTLLETWTHSVSSAASKCPRLRPSSRGFNQI